MKTIDDSIKQLSETPELVKTLYDPVKTKMMEMTRDREAIFFDVMP